MTEPSEYAGASPVWLDWDRPMLQQAAKWLLDHAERVDGLLRLDHIACVTAGRRAGRVLLEETVRQCRERGERMTPFRVLTPGSMVDAIVDRDSAQLRSRASQLECELAWSQALRSQDEQTLRVLLASVPDQDDRAAWMALARMIARLHRELTGHRITFANVAETAARLDRVSDQARWNTLQAIADRYHAVLENLPGGGLIDEEADRLQMAADGSLPKDAHVVLIGVTELNRVQRTLIARLHERVSILIHCPETHAAGFDALGCVQPSYWLDVPLSLRDEQIIVADQPFDQAQQAMRELAKLQLPVDHVTIGVEEQTLADQLELAAKWANLRIHRAEGKPLQKTGPYRLLEVIEDWLDEPRLTTFAALLRHPDLEPLQRQQRPVEGETQSDFDDWLIQLDDYYSEHLHERLTGAWLGWADRSERLRSWYEAVSDWLQPLNGGARPLGEWAEPILKVLTSLYAARMRSGHRATDDRSLDSLLALRDILVEMTAVQAALQPHVPAREAVRMLIDQARESALASPSAEDEIESLGWLELHGDLAPGLMIVGLNDGTIPQAITSDPFLPDTLRSHLGLMDNNRRYARDAYLLEALTHSREQLLVMTGRRSEAGEPLSPSRLLLACERDHLPKRVRLLSDEHAAIRHPLPIGLAGAAERSMFTVPSPPGEPPTVERMSVTSFKKYLTCSYRYWLDQIERLHAVDDTAVELDAMSFGSLIHDVLQRFGSDEVMRDCEDADLIRPFLRDALHTKARDQFGPSPMPAVRVQLDRAARRLDAFAFLQASLRRSGWRIIECELLLPDTAILEVPGQLPMRITGKIDRIDQHVESGAHRIIDYKTSQRAASPMETHHPGKRQRDEWVDLQLPLYRYLAKQIGMKEPMEVGYIVLPRDPSECRWLPADWNEEEHESAIDLARDVVRRVRAGEFDSPADLGNRDDVFANICQTNVYGTDDFDAEQQGGES